MLFRRLSFLSRGILLLLSLNIAGAQHTGPRSTRPLEIINAGIGGNSSASLLLRLDRDVLSRHPDAVVLLLGTNDMLNPARFVSLEIYQKNLIDLVTRFTASGSYLLLRTVPPCYAPYLLSRHAPSLFEGEEPNEKIRAANAIIRTVAQERRNVSSATGGCVGFRLVVGTVGLSLADALGQWASASGAPCSSTDAA